MDRYINRGWIGRLLVGWLAGWLVVWLARSSVGRSVGWVGGSLLVELVQ